MTFSPPLPRHTLLSAYSHLGVSPAQVLHYPRFTPLLSKVEGGRDHVLDALRCSAHLIARRFVEVYDDPLLPAACRLYLPLEAFAIRAEIDSADMRATITSALREYAQIEGSIIAADRHPKMVRLSSELGMLPMGDKDRAMQFKHMGFLPTPKGSQISVSVNANAQAMTQSATIAAKPPEDTIRRLADRFSEGQPQLPAPATVETVPAIMPGESREPEYIDAEMESDADEED